MEWSEIVADAIEGDVIRVDLKNGNTPESRNITITGVEI